MQAKALMAQAPRMAMFAGMGWVAVAGMGQPGAKLIDARCGRVSAGLYERA
jgi:hypothetical protein